MLTLAGRPSALPYPIGHKPKVSTMPLRLTKPIPAIRSPKARWLPTFD